MTSSRGETKGHVLLQKQNPPIPKHLKNQTPALIPLKRTFLSTSAGSGGGVGIRPKSKNGENIITSLRSFRDGRTKPPPQDHLSSAAWISLQQPGEVIKVGVERPGWFFYLLHLDLHT